MRFAITANDRYLGIFEAFLKAGWKPLKLFTVPPTSMLGNQKAVIELAGRNGIPVQLTRMNEQDMQELRDQGCEALIVASYDWLISDWTPYLKYAVNFHCSPLPDGRGAYPTIRAILEKRNSWAITCHRITSRIDGGDILDSETFPMQPDECHESLDLKVQMAAKRLAARVAAQFAPLWENAKPQGHGAYWKKFTLWERVADFSQPVETVLRHIRAFGAAESLAQLGDQWLIVRRAVGWVEKHPYPTGHVVHVFNNSIVVTVADGYVGILESELTPSHIAAELQNSTRPPA